MVRMFRLPLAVAHLACCLVAAQAQTPPEWRASGWVAAPSSRVRLIAPAVLDPAGGVQRGAVEVQLATGAKTYWRNPGETGVPTTASFDGSSGLASLALSYPTPGAFDDGAGGTALGYVGRVVFPLSFTALPATPAAKLAVTLDYGVCTKNMCIPAQARVELPIGDGNASADLAPLVAAAQQAVPVVTALGAPSGPALTEVRAAIVDDKLVVDITARITAGDAAPRLYIDGRDYFSVALDGPVAGDIARFRATSASAPEAGKPLGAMLAVLATEGRAIETRVDLDAAARLR